MLLAACGDCGLSVSGLVTSGMGHIHDHGMALGLCTHTTHVVAVGLWGVSWAGARGSGVWHAIAIAAGGAMGAFPLQRHKCKRAERGPGGDQCAASGKQLRGQQLVGLASFARAAAPAPGTCAWLQSGAGATPPAAGAPASVGRPAPACCRRQLKTMLLSAVAAT